ncbi:hypothetical protein J5N97_028942 [Dioscorea zingiberensis]|uniref:Uncharacterized protein n=1 Tax=Dioscorea zingiberensis TaxID=325984 RepID=A0A9D5C009_9LILI|nr:hypothetical protein J5N97_028942 [Dioscorea zingiberensis]
MKHSCFHQPRWWHVAIIEIVSTIIQDIHAVSEGHHPGSCWMIPSWRACRRVAPMQQPWKGISCRQASERGCAFDLQPLVDIMPAIEMTECDPVGPSQSQCQPLIIDGRSVSRTQVPLHQFFLTISDLSAYSLK